MAITARRAFLRDHERALVAAKDEALARIELWKRRVWDAPTYNEVGGSLNLGALLIHLFYFVHLSEFYQGEAPAGRGVAGSGASTKRGGSEANEDTLAAQCCAPLV